MSSDQRVGRRKGSKCDEHWHPSHRQHGVWILSFYTGVGLLFAGFLVGLVATTAFYHSHHEQYDLSRNAKTGLRGKTQTQRRAQVNNNCTTVMENTTIFQNKHEVDSTESNTNKSVDEQHESATTRDYRPIISIPNHLMFDFPSIPTSSDNSSTLAKNQTDAVPSTLAAAGNNNNNRCHASNTSDQVQQVLAFWNMSLHLQTYELLIIDGILDIVDIDENKTNDQTQFDILVHNATLLDTAFDDIYQTFLETKCQQPPPPPTRGGSLSTTNTTSVSAANISLVVSASSLNPRLVHQLRGHCRNCDMQSSHAKFQLNDDAFRKDVIDLLTAVSFRNATTTNNNNTGMETTPENSSGVSGTFNASSDEATVQDDVPHWVFSEQVLQEANACFCGVTVGEIFTTTVDPAGIEPSSQQSSSLFQPPPSVWARQPGLANASSTKNATKEIPEYASGKN